MGQPITLPKGGIQGRGWAVFEVAGTYGPYQLQRLDEAGLFEDDQSVWTHVVRQANASEELCIRALSFIKTAAPSEWHTILRHCARVKLDPPSVPDYRPPSMRALRGRRLLSV